MREAPNGNDEAGDAEAHDENSRRRIREELSQNFMVEAAAGTGKTTSIVDRMVNLVATGTCRIENLVAVTFTRKAAAELRERFQAELRHRAMELQRGVTAKERETYLRLQSASDYVGHAFVGTIHSFCAALLRERPIEFGIDPVFRELDEEEDTRLREEAWHENITDLFAAGDPLIDQINEYGLDRRDLKSCFDRFIQFRDVEKWPSTEPAAIDLEDIRRQTQGYLQDMRQLLPLFPAERGNDRLMSRYEAIVRSGGRDWKRLGNLFALLEKFDTSPGEVQSKWHDKKVAKQERDRFNAFRQSVVTPAMEWWCRKRYRFVVDFVGRAVSIYEREKLASGGLDFTDLLLIAAKGLKSRPELRHYFQQRFTHLLVDEFQDTDPIQAEMILYLTANDIHQQKWHLCHPRHGSLFLVGDPKQSIYRFRRGDIVTYNRVKSIFEQSGGEVLSLVKNFRSRSELRTWNNKVYRDKFLDRADAYTTAAEDMLQGREDASDGDLRGVWKLDLGGGAILDETTQIEAESIARFIRHAIDSKLTVPRRQREIDLGRGTTVEPRDFLIIPRGKRRIALYKEALDRYHLPCEVTGGNAFLNIDQLGVLIEVLRAVDDPHHPVHYLAILRERLFAFSDDELYAYKNAGGRFAFTSSVPDALDPNLASRFEDVNARLRRYQAWLRSMPFAAAIGRIASDLGLLARAAAESEGNIALGGFLKAIEVLRQHSCDFDSASDLIGYLERLEELDETEGCTALPPDSNVVRVMNLHKAKGLEAPVVFLADTAKRFTGDPICHIDRSSDEAVGYMGITAQKGQWATKEVATPARWKQFQAEEQRFLEAEADRLLYVATTRAACMLVVSVGKDNSNWSGLHPYLDDAPELCVPTEAEVAKLAPKRTMTRIATLDPRQITDRWAGVLRPSYIIESAKEVALKGSPRPTCHASGDYGYKWGSAVHELLEIVAKTPAADLAASALMLAGQYDLGTEQVDELVTTIRSVTQSEIWKRSQAATQCFSELPFEAIDRNEDGTPIITRGVIDLLFEEFDGWVIVDYKSDDLSSSDIESAVNHYRHQLIGYAAHWQKLTAAVVKEAGLYFTKLDRYVTV